MSEKQARPANITPGKFNSNRKRGSIAIAVAIAGSAIFPLISRAAVTRTWDGGGTSGTNVDTAVNWSGDTVPNATNSDVAQWDGTVAGALSLTYTAAGTGANLAGGSGVFINVTPTQTSSISINEASGTANLRLQNITIASGAGAFTIGGAAGNDILALGATSITAHTWTNNSANTATIGNDVFFAFGGGTNNKTMTLTGSGNWSFGGKFGNSGTGSLGSLVKSGAGTLTITNDITGVNGSAQATGAGSVFVKAGTMLIGTGGAVSSTSLVNAVTASIGQNGSDNGTLTLQGTGAFTSAGDFSVGDSGSSQGTLNVQDTSTLTVNSAAGFFVGSANAASSTAGGTVTQTGGTVTVNKTTDGFFIIGGRIAGASGTGTYNLGGTGTVTNAGNAWIGGYGIGTVTQTGGTWNNAGSVSIGRQAGSSGSYVISAGALNQTGGSTGIVVAQDGTGVLTVSGGAAVTTNAAVRIGGSVTATGTVNLNGGTITTPTVNSVGGTSTFNFNGGTLKAGANNAAFLAGLTTANVRNGGAVIDTNSFNVTIGQSLLHSAIGGDAATDGGLTKNGAGTLTMTGGSSYTGPTNVTNGTLAFSTAQSTVGSLTVADGATFSAKHTTGSIPTVTTTSMSIGSTGSPNLNFDFNNVSAPTAALVSTGVFTANGTVGVSFANAAQLITGSYRLVSYSSFAGTGTFPGSTYTFSPRVSGTIANNGTNALLLNVVADKPVWTGLDNNGTSGSWVVGPTGANANWKLQTAGGPTDYIEGDAVIFDDSATGVTSVDLSGPSDINPVSVVFNNSLSKSYTIISSGGFGIAGTGLMIKNNTGAVTIAESNSYSGGTTINNGTLNLNAANALGTGAVALTGGKLDINNGAGLGTGALTITGGTLDNTNGSTVVLSTTTGQNWNGDFAFAGSNDLNMVTSAVSLGGSGTSRTVTVNAGTLTVGTISSATKGLTKAGPGRLAITTSVQSVIAGTLNVTGGTLQINTGGDSTTTNDFVAGGLAGTGTIENGGGSERWLYVNTAGSDTFAGVLQDGTGGGALGLNKLGTGSLTLTGTNAFTGTTTLSGGTLIAANTSALGNTLRLNAAANLSTTFIYDTDGGDNTVPIGLTSGTTSTTQLTIVSDRATAGAAVNRTMTVPTSNGLGGGTLNFTAGPNVTSGTPVITFTQLGLAAGSGTTTTLNPTGVNLSIGNISKFSNSPAQTLALDGTTAGNEITGVISNGTAVVSITKTNSSTWKLSGNNSYSGTTTLTAGTLIAASTSALGGTDRMNVINTTGGGPTFIFDTDGTSTDNTVPIGLGTGAAFTVVSDRPTPGASVDRTMTVPNGNGLGGGTITFTSGPNIISGTPTVSFAQIGLGAGSGTTTTLNPTGVKLSIGNISKFNNTPAQTIEFGGTTTGNEVTGTISNGTATVSVKKSNGSTWTLSGSNSYTGSTNATGGRLVLGQSLTSSPTVTASGGTIELAAVADPTIATNVIKTNTLSASAGGKINLQNNKAIVVAGNYTTMAGLVLNGRAGGTWTGANGIGTSQPDAAAGRTAIAAALNSDLPTVKATFGGQGVNPNDVLLMYTYDGDANMDGVINGDDYSQIDAGFASQSAKWVNGDFNYDGKINADDYFIIDHNYSQQSLGMFTSASSPALDLAGVSAVPEPGCLAIVGLAAAGAISRRRRR